MTDYEKRIVLEIQRNMENGLSLKDACMEATSYANINKIARAYKRYQKEERRRERQQDISDYRSKVADGFAYGIGYNTARTVAPAVKKVVVDRAKKYYDDHDLDMGGFSEFIESYRDY